MKGRTGWVDGRVVSISRGGFKGYASVRKRESRSAAVQQGLGRVRRAGKRASGCALAVFEGGGTRAGGEGRGDGTGAHLKS
jgi:hypothetical protein